MHNNSKECVMCYRLFVSGHLQPSVWPSAASFMMRTAQWKSTWDNQLYVEPQAISTLIFHLAFTARLCHLFSSGTHVSRIIYLSRRNKNQSLIVFRQRHIIDVRERCGEQSIRNNCNNCFQIQTVTDLIWQCTLADHVNGHAIIIRYLLTRLKRCPNV